MIADVAVAIDGSVCTVTSVVATEIVCNTGPHGPASTNGYLVEVTTANAGLATNPATLAVSISK